MTSNSGRHRVQGTLARQFAAGAAPSVASEREDAGVERAKAERIATVIFDAIHSSFATKADVQASDARLMARLDQIERTVRQGR